MAHDGHDHDDDDHDHDPPAGGSREPGQRQAQPAPQAGNQGHTHGAHGDHSHGVDGDHGHGDHSHGDDAHADHGHGGDGTHDHAHGDHDHDDHGHGDPGHGDHSHGHDHGDDDRDGGHGHHHPHTAGHRHDFAPHGEAHEHEGLRTEPLAEGAGAGKTLFFDAFSGLAGDMTIAGLLDLGVPLLVVERAVAALPLEGFHLHRGHAHFSGIVGTKFDVHVEARQPERTFSSIDKMIVESHLTAPVKDLARRIFRKLGEAEAAVHRTPIEDVHFHEVGAVDAIVDIVGAAACLVYLGADTITASPLPMGRGFVKARHGVLPLPAPATVSCLRGVPTYAVDVDAELVTPTGAAIIATVARQFERWPSFAPERVGWGAGSRPVPDRPNLLRLVLGKPTGGRVAESTSVAGTHVVLEANIDDMSGELAGHAISQILAAGALDAWVVPTTMKKGRPGLLLCALAERDSSDAIAAVILRETSTLGVRHIAAVRTERPRKTVEVETPFGPIPVKISEGAFGPAVIKPEFDACVAAATRHGVPVRVVLAAALARVDNR